MNLSDHHAVVNFMNSNLEDLFSQAARDEDRLELMREVLNIVCRRYQANVATYHDRQVEMSPAGAGARVSVSRRSEEGIIAFFDVQQIKGVGKGLNSGLFETMYNDQPGINQPKRFESSTGGIETVIRAFQRFLNEVVLTPQQIEVSRTAQRAKKPTVEPS